MRDKKIRWVVESSVQSWLEALQEDYPDLDSSNFYTSLEEFLNTTGTVYTSDIIFNNDENIILSSRLTGNHIFRDSSSRQVKSMKSLRKDVRDVANDYPILKRNTQGTCTRSPFRNVRLFNIYIYVCILLLLAGDKTEEVRAYAAEYVVYEQYDQIRDEFFRNVGSATAAILVVIVLMIPSYRVSVTVFLTVALTIFVSRNSSLNDKKC